MGLVINNSKTYVKMVARTLEIDTLGWLPEGEYFRKIATVEEMIEGADVSYALHPSNIREAGALELICVEQGIGTLTFEVVKVPENNILVNLMIFIKE